MPSTFQTSDYAKPQRAMREITNSPIRPLYFINPLTMKENPI